MDSYPVLHQKISFFSVRGSARASASPKTGGSQLWTILRVVRYRGRAAKKATEHSTTELVIRKSRIPDGSFAIISALIGVSAFWKMPVKLVRLTRGVRRAKASTIMENQISSSSIVRVCAMLAK